MTPDELETIGTSIGKIFLDEVDGFRPFLDFPFATSAFWIFQGNPKRFDIDRYLRSRSEITWTVNQYLKDVRVGDRVLMWRSGADGGVVAECEIIDGPSAKIADDGVELHNANVPPDKPGTLRCKLRVIEAFPDNPVPRQLIQSNLPDLSIFKFAQNTNFPISEADYESILRLKSGASMIESSKMREEPLQNPDYSIEDLASNTGFHIETLERWKRGLERKGQVIFYGPPGTGKTFIADKLSKHIVSGTDGAVELVQFHPAYSYEDFMQGIRPKLDSGELSYFRAAGRFIEFCDRAKNRAGPCVLIIDEINRANLSRVFGELMYLLEYRDQQIPLAVGGTFRIPKNVRLIGTMNTADRSIALVDHALRRRFAFIPLHPEYDILLQYQKAKRFDATKLIQRLKLLNKVIADPRYEVGITFFLRDDLASSLSDIWQMEIEPYLEEFFFDQPQKFDQFRWEVIRDDITP
jgi:MoxR-like ATPase